MTASKIAFLSEHRATPIACAKQTQESVRSGAIGDWWSDPALAEAAEATIRGRLVGPFGFLGPHPKDGGIEVRIYQPGARRVFLLSRRDGATIGEAEPWRDGLFVARLPQATPYLLRIEWNDGATQETEDPYAFSTVLGDLDLHLLSEGSHWRLADVFGAHRITLDGIDGVAFSVWAPNARRVAVIGDFNSWDGRRHPMRLRHAAGVWELFVPRLGFGIRYKYEIQGPDGTVLPAKADPLARASEVPPATASIVAPRDDFAWSDDDWLKQRARRQSADAPLSIYEVHAESWLRPDGRALDWDGLGQRLIPYAADMGFTHIELLPVMGHPFSGSWGYQPLSLFATAAQLGERDGFKRFVDLCHRHGLGVILDWVPGHFPADAHGLARFDGSHLYEHADPREGFHQDWNTCIYNYGRREVQGFLIASALHWLETFHLDGLRVDAVASMLYRDYSREPGEWVPNIHGGRENLEAVAFLRRMNEVIVERHPGVMVIAEESTAWPGVTAPTAQQGLGFSYKWNMGWMHDSLRYMQREAIHRTWHHDDLTFGLLYAYSERFVLPLSHDEVVHGKGSLIARMPGDPWQRFANLRAYLTFMWAHPGKKLLFMGGEIAQESEWDYRGQIDWFLLDRPEHLGVQRLTRDLNRLYRENSVMHAADADPRGFRWIVGDDHANSVFAFLRCADRAAPVLCVFNMTPVPHQNYRIGVPRGGYWREMINSDGQCYGGGNAGNAGGVIARDHGSHGEPYSLELLLPPLSGVILRPED